MSTSKQSYEKFKRMRVQKEDERGKEGPANCKAVMSTSWKDKDKEERGGKGKGN